MRIKQPSGDLAKYIKAYLISLKVEVSSPKKVFTLAFMSPFRVLILVFIYTYAFKYLGKDINGIGPTVAIWSMAIYHILLFTQFRGIFRMITEDIKNGNLEVQINKPYNYLIYKFFDHLGRSLPNFIAVLLVMIPMLLILTNGLPTTMSLPALFAAICLILAGTLVSAGLYILISLPALWIDDAQPFFWIIDKLIMVLGGAYIPLALLPGSFQTFANLTPFGAPMFATQMFNPSFADSWLLLFMVQIFWIIILLLSISFIFGRAERRLSINGG